MRALKRALGVFLAISILFPAPHLLADDTTETRGVVTRRDQLRAEFDDIVYSIENIPRIVENFSQFQQAGATHGMTESVIRILMDRFIAARDLMSVLYADPTITKEERKKYINDLNSAVANLVQQVAFNEGEDLTVEQFDKMVAKGPGSSTSMLREFVIGLKGIFTFRRSNNNELVWRFLDRINRQSTVAEMLGELQDFAKYAVPLRKPDEGVRKYTEVFWAQEDAESEPNAAFANYSTLMAEARLKGQRRAALAYFTLAFAGLVAPIVNWVGLFERMFNGGTVSDVSFDLSSYSYFAFWFAAGVLQTMSLSSEAIAELKRFKAVLMYPDASIPLYKDIQKNRKGLLSRVISGVGSKCVLLLGGKGKPIGASSGS